MCPSEMEDLQDENNSDERDSPSTSSNEDEVTHDISNNIGEPIQPVLHVNDFCELLPDPTTGRTVTVFLCGTGSTRDDAGETVSHTYSITEGDEFINKIIADGVGSGEKDTANYWIDYVNHLDLAGKVAAKGTNARAAHVLAVLKNEPTRKLLSDTSQQAHTKLRELLEQEGNHITRVNILGWSRGAANAINLANRMSCDEALKNIEVNLVLLDPVAGLGKAHKNNCTLPLNVRNCVVIYSKDERSVGFSAVAPSNREHCQTRIYLMPGGHAQVSGSELDHGGNIHEKADPDLRGVATLSRFLVERYLYRFGTKLEKNKMLHLTLDDVLKYYDEIKRNESQYKEIAQRISYTRNQIQGEDRKVVDYNNWFFNTYLSSISPEFNATTYVDANHEALDGLIKKTNVIVNELTNNLDTRDEKKLSETIDNIKKQMEKESRESIRLSCCAIGEGLQKKYSPNDLTDSDKRCHTIDALEKLISDLANSLVNNEGITSLEAQLQTAQNALDTTKTEAQTHTEEAATLATEWQALRQTNTQVTQPEQDGRIAKLDEFREKHLKKAEKHRYSAHYKQSIEAFCTEGKNILLASSLSEAQQNNQLQALAHKSFHHRHLGRRMLADALMMIGILFAGTGLAMGLYRKYHNKTFFYSTDTTKRTKEIKKIFGTETTDSLTGHITKTRNSVYWRNNKSLGDT